MSQATAGPPPHTTTSVMPLDYVRERRVGDGDLPSGGEISVAFDRAQRGRGGRVSCRRLSRKRARRPGARLHAAGRCRGRVHRRTGGRGVGAGSFRAVERGGGGGGAHRRHSGGGVVASVESGGASCRGRGCKDG